MATLTRAVIPPPKVPLIDTFTWREGRDTIHGPPSNFWIEPDGTCVEAEFQWEKIRSTGKVNPWKLKAMLPRMHANPGIAKKIGRTFDMSAQEIEHWESIRLDVMLDLVRRKAHDHPEFREWLIATEDAKLVEGNWWHDQFWGSCQCQQHFYRHGANHLGRILMGIRDALTGKVDDPYWSPDGA